MNKCLFRNFIGECRYNTSKYHGAKCPFETSGQCDQVGHITIAPLKVKA